MPLSEILDRFTITLIKQERTEFDVTKELFAYQQELDQHPYDFTPYVERLKHANEKIWDLETEGHRQSDNPEQLIALTKLGEIALEVRKWNKIRNGIKAEIVEKFHEGFQDIPINYTKSEYGGRGN